MASVIKVNGRWRAQVRKKGHPARTETFDTKILAQAWAKSVEADIDSARSTGSIGGKGVLFSKLVDRYTDEVGSLKPFGRNKEDVISRIREYLGKVTVPDLSPERVVKYITEERMVRGVTAAIDLTYIKGILKVARSLWKYPVSPALVDDAREILRHMGQLDRSEERDRRPTDDELVKLRAWFAERSASLTPDLIDFILDSGFRPPSELERLRWADLNRKDRTIVIRDRKDPRKKLGNNQTVPLLGRCMAIIDRQPHPEGAEFIFDFNGKSWSTLWPRACRDLKIHDLRLYDLRHEAISRLVEANRHSIPEIMLISGHKDPKQMMRYTQLRAKNLHREPVPAPVAAE